MKRLALLGGLLALAAPLATPLAQAQTSTWTPNPAHSDVSFSILHLSLSKVRGHFGPISGKVILDTADIAKSTVDVTIDVTGVNTGSSLRDDVLRSPSFFNLARFPTATFASTSVAPAPGGLTVTGNLTLLGVTRPVVLHVKGPIDPVTHTGRKAHEEFSASAVLNRSDFGVGAGYPDKIVGDQVDLTIDMDLVKQ